MFPNTLDKLEYGYLDFLHDQTALDGLTFAFLNNKSQE